jgi:predicted Zn-dependent peptidase
MNKLWLMLVLITSTSLAFAQKGKIKFEEYDLDNGLHVILHQDNSTPIVAVTVSYHVGSKNEELGRTGFAHFFEHLLFEGTENIERGEFDTYVTEAGGALNANTSQDRTFYYEVLPSNEFKLGLWLESERMLHAKIEEVGVETQREVVKEEKRQRMDNQPYGSFLYEMFSRAYTVHPYTWIPIGSMDDLNAAEIDEFRAFYKKFYVPNNACLSIAGDIDVKETKEWIEKYFGSIPRGEDVVQPSIVEPALGGEKRATIYDNIQLPGLMLGYRIPPYTEADFYAIDMLGYVLSNGQSSRLNKKLVEEDQSAIQVFAFPFPLEDGGLFVTFAIANAGKQLSDMEGPIDSEIARLQTELISDNEYEKIMNQIENDFVSSNGRISGIAESLSDYYLYYGDANLINTELALYQKVTKEDIMRVAKKYLVKDNRVVLEYLPMSEKPTN